MGRKYVKYMKAKTIKKTTKPDPEITELFNQMIGEGALDPYVILPKYESLMAECVDITKALSNIFVDKKFIPAPLYHDNQASFKQIEQFCRYGSKYLSTVTLEREPPRVMPADFKIMSNEDLLELARAQLGFDPAHLQKLYLDLKSSQIVDKIITAVRDLNKLMAADKKKHKKEHHDLEFKESLNDTFITKYPDEYLSPITSITDLDFKQVWLHEHCDYTVRKRFIYGLFLLLDKGNRIVKLIMSPDVDIAKFSEKMVESLQKLKTRIPRCEKAFAKIAKSVNLLQDNFSDYYKDFLVAQNPNVILENFISDVSVSSKADPDTIRQFRTIIEHCRSNFMGNNKDPKIEKIFEVLNTNMEILEKKVKPQQSGSSESAESE